MEVIVFFKADRGNLEQPSRVAGFVIGKRVARAFDLFDDRQVK